MTQPFSNEMEAILRWHDHLAWCMACKGIMANTLKCPEGLRLYLQMPANARKLPSSEVIEHATTTNQSSRTGPKPGRID
jgi:hypothetical protein